MNIEEKVEKSQKDKKETIQKPVAILVEELDTKVATAIKESGLHINMVVNYFQQFTAHLEQLAEENRKAEIAQYKAQLAEFEQQK